MYGGYGAAPQQYGGGGGGGGVNAYGFPTSGMPGPDANAPPHQSGIAGQYAPRVGGRFRREDDDICPFFSKMGSCRHGERCTKKHTSPISATTVLLPMTYPNPKIVPLQTTDRNGEQVTIDYDAKWLKKHVNDFYEDVFLTLMEYGRINQMKVLDNLCEHLLGNVYISFESESAALSAVEGLRGKMYNGILLLPELSPVRDFEYALCKEDADGGCKRGALCNFWHITSYPKPASSLLRDLEKQQKKHWGAKEGRDERKRERSPARDDRRPRRDDDRDRRRDDDRDRRPSSRDDDRRRDDRYDDRRRESDRPRDDRRYDDRRDDRRRESPPRDMSRICHICGRTGHQSRDCALKNQ
jgi:splicing factor U2AF subunit